MKFWPILLLNILLVSCSVFREINPALHKSLPTSSSLPDLGPAPELTNNIWLNTPQSLRLADLQGQVVLLEMWTFG
jgi:hypothetical protein